MTILVVHNFYQQAGGEDAVFADEVGLLEAHGHRVVPFTLHNDAIRQMSGVALAARTVWNHQVHRQLRLLVERERPDVVHFHNTFPLISAAAFHAVRGQGAAVVQTLHNYRLLCPAATLLRDGSPCELCVGKRFAWPALVYACYRHSRAASAVAAGAHAAHRLLGTWRRCVDVHIALTQFSRRLFVRGGLPPERVTVKPNHVSDCPIPAENHESYAVFVARLSPEKGIDVLLRAWEHVGARMPLRIIGDGPLAAQVRQAAEGNPHIQWLGRLPPDETRRVLGRAALLVFPSLWYETFGRVVAEAFAASVPVVASDHGAMREMIEPGRTGMLFAPGNAEDLARRVIEIASDGGLLRRMRSEARGEYEARYTPQRNYRLLMDVYDAAIRQRVVGCAAQC